MSDSYSRPSPRPRPLAIECPPNGSVTASPDYVGRHRLHGVQTSRRHRVIEALRRFPR